MRLTGLVLTLCLALVPLGVEGQQTPKGPQAAMPRVGVLSPFTFAAAADDIRAFRQGIRDLGYVDGQNIAIETRWAEGHLDRLQVLAAELVQLKMTVIITHSDPAVRAVKEVSRTVPIVAAFGADLVGAGHAISFARPGGQITGLVDMAPDVGAKRVELLKELLPTLKRIGVLWNVANSPKAREFEEVVAGARTLGLGIESLEVRNAEDLEREFILATRARLGAILVLPDVLTTINAKADRWLRGGSPRADNVRPPGWCRCRWTDGLWSESTRLLSSGRGVCRQDPEGSATGRPSDPTAHHVRAGDQPEDRQGVRSHCPAIIARACRPSN